jgi:hypothetical protein
MRSSEIHLRAARPVVLELGLDTLVALARPSQSCISCRSGAVWITAGTAEDVVLFAGDVFEVPDAGRTLIYAVEASRVTLEGAAKRSFWQKASRLWRKR